MNRTPAVVWVTGLPSSGKSTFAVEAATFLRDIGEYAIVLDGDSVRSALSPAPGYTALERDNFYTTLARLAHYLASQGVVVLVPATAHLRRYRDQAREIAPVFLEVYMETPREVCRERDAKGLYLQSETGNVSMLPGAGLDYEPPLNPDLVVHHPPQRDRFDNLYVQLCQARNRLP